MAGEVRWYDYSEDIIKAMRNVIKQGLRAGGKVIIEQARQNMPPNLRDTLGSILAIRTHIDSRTGQPAAHVGYVSRSNKKAWAKATKGGFVPNPSWFEYGRKPHVVEAGINNGKPSGKKALSDGKVIYGKRVTVGAIAGGQYVARAAQAKGKEAHDLCIEKLTKIATMSLDNLKGEAAAVALEIIEYHEGLGYRVL